MKKKNRKTQQKKKNRRYKKEPKEILVLKNKITQKLNWWMQQLNTGDRGKQTITERYEENKHHF